MMFLERFIDFHLQHRLFVLIGLAGLVGLGLWALSNIPVDAFPDLTNNQVVVVTEAPGMAPVEVEQLVTFPIEAAMMGLPHTEQVRSISKLGLSIVTIVFEDSVEAYFARQLVNERLQEARARIPAGLEPSLGPVATAFGEIYQYTLESGAPSPMELKTIQEWQIKPQLRAVPGVGAGVRWSTMLALAFCSLDFAGIASLVTQKGQAEKDKESWFLFAAWLIAAAFNAALTWWGVSIAISNHPLRSAEVLNTQNLTTIVPVLVAIMVWVIRVLIIGSLTSSLDKSSRAQRSSVKSTRTTVAAGYAINTQPTSGYSRPQPATSSTRAMKPRSIPASMARPAPKPYSQPVNSNDFISAESQGSRHL